MEQTDPPERGDGRLILVAGSGRSGTSTMTGTLAMLGAHVPQPEVPADDTNPRGFFEPQWLVEHHQALLGAAGVPVSDARPAAAVDAAAAAATESAQEQRRRWATAALSAAPHVVLKDPRISWFLPAWQQTARLLGVDAGVVVMLRHPAAVVESKTASYHRRPDGSRRAGDVGDAARVAGWVNVLLLVEQAARAGPNVFVRYDDVLADWRSVAGRVTTALGLHLSGWDGRTEAEVDGFVNPDLRHTAGTSWADLDVPVRLRDLAEETWRLLGGLGDGQRSGADRAAAFDALRADYDAMYDEAERIVGFSLRAARRAPGRGRKGRPRR